MIFDFKDAPVIVIPLNLYQNYPISNHRVNLFISLHDNVRISYETRTNLLQIEN